MSRNFVDMRIIQEQYRAQKKGKQRSSIPASKEGLPVKLDNGRDSRIVARYSDGSVQVTSGDVYEGTKGHQVVNRDPFVKWSADRRLKLMGLL